MSSAVDDPLSSDENLDRLEQQRRELEHLENAVQEKQGELQKLDIEIQKKQIEYGNLELDHRKGRFSRWLSKESGLVVIIAAVIALSANTIVAGINLLSAHTLKTRDLEQSLMLRAMESDDDIMRSNNLKWFLDLGWLRDKDNKIALAIIDHTVPRIPPQAMHITSDLILGGGFEAPGSWVIPESTVPATYVSPPSPVHSGGLSAQLGSTEPIVGDEVYSTIYQQVVIPANALNAVLTCWLFGTGTQPSEGPAYREIRLTDEEFNTVAVLYRTSDNNPHWSNHTFDLTSMIGQTLYIVFAVRNSGSGEPLAMYVDDVALLVSR